MPSYTFDHVHLRSREPDELVEFCQRMFGATIIASPEVRGVKTVMLDFGQRVHVTGGRPGKRARWPALRRGSLWP